MARKHHACRPPGWGQRCRKEVRRNATFIVLIGLIVVGFVAGVLIHRTHPSAETVMWLGFPGEIFIRLLSVSIIPLIMCSVISGTASMDAKSNGKAGALAFAYIMVQNFSGSLIGLALGLVVKPGRGTEPQEHVKNTGRVMKTQDIFADLIRNLFPDNIVRATLQKAYTSYVDAELPPSSTVNSSMETLNFTNHVVRQLAYSNSTNLLGLVTFCVIAGMAIASLKEKAAIIRDFFCAGNDVMRVILKWYIWFAPIGVCSLMISAIAGAENLGGLFVKLAILIATAMGGALLQILGLYPLAYLVIARRNPFIFMAKCIRLMAMSFAIISSVVVMPEVLTVCEDSGCDPRMTRLVVPLLITVNASGSALYISLASLFVVQAAQLTLNAGQLVLIFILSGMSSLALPVVPSGSIITMVIIMETLGLPHHTIGILFAVDFLLDRFRTMSNCVSKVMGAAAISHLCGAELRRAEMEMAGPEGESLTKLRAEEEQEEEQEEEDFKRS